MLGRTAEMPVVSTSLLFVWSLYVGVETKKSVPVCDIIDEYSRTFAHGEERIFLDLSVGG
jgi:hypothetical protein